MKSDFYARLQHVIYRAAKKDLALLLDDFNAKVGSKNTGFETAMGKHGLDKMNNNEELLVDLCSFNNLVIGGNVFSYKKTHKVTWISPNNRIENQIDYMCVCWRSSGGRCCMLERRDRQTYLQTTTFFEKIPLQAK